jgi:hypothetical protein
MFYEICLIQRFTLFLGYPTYSLTVTLFSLLVFSGIGSLMSGRIVLKARAVLPWLLLGLAVLTAWMEWGAPAIVNALGASALGVRVVIVCLTMAPLGLLLGTFMPIGLATVNVISGGRRSYVAWAWAVNGFFSVVSSVLATLLSMSFGFTAVLGLALGIYAVGIAALWRVTPAVARS